MALAAYDIHFHYSGAGSLLGSQSDPNASLGDYIASASDRLYHTQGQVSSWTNGSRFSSAALTSPNVGDWVLFITGGIFLQAAKIAAVPAALTVQLDRPIVGYSGSEYFRIHSKHNLFDQIAAAEALSGESEYRAIYVRNETSVTLTVVRLYLAVPFGGAPEFALASKSAVLSNIGNIANENIEPDLGTSLSDNNARFETNYDYDIAYPSAGINLTNNNQVPMWLRRTVDAASRPQKDVVWAVVLEGSNTGGDPDPIQSAALVTFDGEGITPAITLERDRYTFIGGGGRITATIVDESGTPIPELDIQWSVTGSGAFNETTGQTDDDGEHTVSYAAPIDQAEAGTSATITAEVV